MSCPNPQEGITDKEIWEDYLLPFRRGPPSILWELTYDCNLSCCYCYNSCPKKAPGALSPWHRRKVARKLAASCMVGENGICFTGGEPTLAPDFMELAGIFHKEGHHSGMITNGIGIAPERISKILDYFNRIKISLDTLAPEEAARINGDPKAPEIAVNALRLLEKEGYDMRCVTLAMVRPWFDMESISEVLELAGELGVYRVVGGPPQPFGRAWDRRYSAPQPGGETLNKAFSRKYPKTDFCLSCDGNSDSQLNFGLMRELSDSFWLTPGGSLKVGFLPFTFGNILKEDILSIFGSYYQNRVYKSLFEEYLQNPPTPEERQQLRYRRYRLPPVEMERAPFLSPEQTISPPGGPGGIWYIAPKGDMLSFLEVLALEFSWGRSVPEITYILTRLNFTEEEIREAVKGLLRKKAAKLKWYKVPTLGPALADLEERISRRIKRA